MRYFAERVSDKEDLRNRPQILSKMLIDSYLTGYTFAMHAKYSAKRRLGNVGEDIACQFLEGKGFIILERNYLRAWGEIDIIAVKSGAVRFIEVKAVSRERMEDISREKDGYRPEEQVHPAKLKKLARTAEMYMNEKEDTRDYQIDVVTVFMDLQRRIARCRLYEQVL